MATKVTTFVVSGTMFFPVDMLRYDACWPATSDDAVRMGEALDTRMRQARFKDDHQYRWKVALTTHSPSITTGRWRSFGWEVENIGPSLPL